MRDANAPCGRLGWVPHLPEGESLSIVIDRLAFDEDCARAEVVVSALTAPAHCRALAFDERRLALTGAVGLNWDGKEFVVSADRGALEDRPWSPALKRPLADRVVRPGAGAATPGADPADPTMEPAETP